MTVISVLYSEKNIYGRSAFQDRIRAEKKEQKAQGARAVTFDRIKGKGIRRTGFYPAEEQHILQRQWKRRLLYIPSVGEYHR